MWMRVPAELHQVAFRLVHTPPNFVPGVAGAEDGGPAIGEPPIPCVHEVCIPDIVCLVD